MTGKLLLHETTAPPMTSLHSHPPPPPAPPFSAVFSGSLFSPPPAPATTSRYHLTPGKVAAVCFFSALFIFLSSFLYLIIRFISSSSPLPSPSSSSSSSSSSPAAVDGGVEESQSPELRRRVVDFLPAIIFRPKGGGREQECSICLGKFLHNEELRVLPICCHVFHSVCVDLWLLSNLSCPLCRSSIDITDSELMKRITTASSPSSTVRSDSIRSDDDEMEAAAAPAPPGPWLAAEVAEQKSWLREYFDRFTSTASSSSRSLSLLGSGRFVFTGSSRRSGGEGEGDDVGVEISEMFSFFSLM